MLRAGALKKAGDRLYATDQIGTTIVFRAGPEKYEQLAENKRALPFYKDVWRPNDASAHRNSIRRPCGRMGAGDSTFLDSSNDPIHQFTRGMQIRRSRPTIRDSRMALARQYGDTIRINGRGNQHPRRQT